jgi:hypothetical protein
VATASTVAYLTVAPEGRDVWLLRALHFTGLAAEDLISAALVGGLGLFIVLSGIGILRLHPWAWLVAMALQGWTLAVFLLDYFTRGQSSYSTALLSVIIVFYLNSRTIRRAFDLVRRREAMSARPPLEPPNAMAAEPEIPAGSAKSARPAPAQGHRGTTEAEELAETWKELPGHGESHKRRPAHRR